MMNIINESVTIHFWLIVVNEVVMLMMIYPRDDLSSRRCVTNKNESKTLRTVNIYVYIQSSALGALSTLVTSVVLYSLT